MSELVGSPEDRFSHDAALMITMGKSISLFSLVAVMRWEVAQL